MHRWTLCLAVSVALFLGSALSATAQQATPIAATPVAEGGFEALFVQTVPGAILEPEMGSEGHFSLVLSDALAQTVIFANRPDRFAGTVPTSQVVDAVNNLAEGGDPANAALVGQLADGSEEIVVVELLGAVRSENSITYDVLLLGADDALSFGLEAEPLSALTERREYGVSNLFIDDIWCLLDGRC